MCVSSNPKDQNFRRSCGWWERKERRVLSLLPPHSTQNISVWLDYTETRPLDSFYRPIFRNSIYWNDCWVGTWNRKWIILRGDKEDPHERDMEQEIEFSNHENNWFKSYEILRLFYRETVLRENNTVPGNSEMKLLWGLGGRNTLTKSFILCFVVPVKGNHEGSSQFEEKESSLSFPTEKSSRLIGRKKWENP